MVEKWESKVSEVDAVNLGELHNMLDELKGHLRLILAEVVNQQTQERLIVNEVLCIPRMGLLEHFKYDIIT